jgi:hypothetical protein
MRTQRRAAAIAALEQQEIAGWKDRTVADIEIIGTLDAEARNAIAVEKK